ncbi:MAG: hypothetical protein IT405_01730 [Candidatus Yanofskybacteria bacterium]|nr:hypothetical protein [Candidatus Yanofskybacteria bacterium]
MRSRIGEPAATVSPTLLTHRFLAANIASARGFELMCESCKLVAPLRDWRLVIPTVRIYAKSTCQVRTMGCPVEQWRLQCRHCRAYFTISEYPSSAALAALLKLFASRDLTFPELFDAPIMYEVGRDLTVLRPF